MVVVKGPDVLPRGILDYRHQQGLDVGENEKDGYQDVLTSKSKNYIFWHHAHLGVFVNRRVIIR